MGGFFQSSSPAPVYTPPAASTTDADAEARKLREEAMARNRRGRAGMVATSERGVLGTTSAPIGTATKTLLGE